MAEPRRVPLIVLGVGQVGSTFLSRLLRSRGALRDRYGTDLYPVALADRTGALFDAQGLAPDRVQAATAPDPAPGPVISQPGALADLSAEDLVQHAVAQGVENAIVVDVTAVRETDDALRQALDAGYGVVLANKRPLARDWERARIFYEHPRVHFEATVGAGLPIVSTLRALRDAGDRIERIEGALSGTLSYLCSRLGEGEAFSVIVGAARARGYTEPDPREDLSGVDVGRKMLILGRLAGWPLEADDLQIDPLYPSNMAEMSTDQFMAELPKLDSDFAAYINGLAGVPRYLAEIGPSGGMVSLRMVGERLAAPLRGQLNQITVWTELYGETPLTISGPGGGPEGAATAVLNNCLLLARTGLDPA